MQYIFFGLCFVFYVLLNMTYPIKDVVAEPFQQAMIHFGYCVAAFFGAWAIMAGIIQSVKFVDWFSCYRRQKKIDSIRKFP